MTTSRDAWILTATGRRFNPLDPKPADVCIEDIAHALSMICRYGGHSRWHYSVAQHSILLVGAVARDQPQRFDWALMALLHDGAEAYLVDVPRPIKPFLTGYYEMEARVEHAITRALSLPADPDGAALVKAYDSRILVDESRILMGAADWARHFGEPLGVAISQWSPWTAEQNFLGLYRLLKSAINAAEKPADIGEK